MTEKESNIALIHATPLAMAPVAAAFSSLWPQARLMNLLDDSLSVDLAAHGGLNDAVFARIDDLLQYCLRRGVDGVLFTCSAFGPAIDAAARRTGVPVLKPNEAMFEEALDVACTAGSKAPVGLVTTFAPSSVSMRIEFEALAQAMGSSTRIVSACADGAMALLQAGNAVEHDRRVIIAARELREAGVLMLGQFSMAHARAAVEEATGRRVLTSPESAVRKLQRLIAS